MKKHVVLILLLLCTQFGAAQTNDANYEGLQHMWSNFVFTLHGAEQKMFLYYAPDGKVNGRYYENCQKKIFFEGTRAKNILSLTGYCNGKIYCYVTIDNNPDSLQFHGFWYDSLKAQKTAFISRTDYATWGDAGQRYSPFANFNAGFNDDTVEAYALAIKNAVIAGNKEWIANQVQFPVKPWVNKKALVIHNKQEFLANYNRIFTPAVIEGVKAACPYNLDVWKTGASFYNFTFNSGDTENRLRIVEVN